MADLRHLFSSPSPAASLGSDAMLESVPSSPEPAAASDVDDGPAFPLEGIYYDSADRLALGNARRCSTFDELLEGIRAKRGSLAPA